MKKNENDVHYGQAVKEKLKERGMTVSEFSKRISRSRTDVYDIFNRKYIDVELLNIISEVLHHNFLKKMNNIKW